MKIGEFARTYDIPKDTVRYYVNIGLLVPKMQGSQMNFTVREQKDLEYIQQLKRMRFNIKEIKAFLYLSRMSHLIEPATIEEYLELLSVKRKSLLEEYQMMAESIRLVDEEIERFEQKKNVKKTGSSGVPLSAVQLLHCPYCRKQLSIENAEIHFKYLMKGQLICDCGYQAQIEQGIVKTGNLYTGRHDRPDLKRQLYHDTGEEFPIAMHKCTEYMLEKIEQRELRGKVVLESNVNGFFFTYNFLHEMPGDCLYIFTDKYEEVLLMYKNLIEILVPELEVLYIADASEHIPIKDSSIDLFLSFFGENEYSFYHSNAQLTDIKRLMKPDAAVLGSFQCISTRSVTSRNLREQYPEGTPFVMDLDHLMFEYKKCGYISSACQLGTVMNTKKHHMYLCHVDGEPIEMYGFEACPEKPVL